MPNPDPILQVVITKIKGGWKVIACTRTSTTECEEFPENNFYVMMTHVDTLVRELKEANP